MEITEASRAACEQQAANKIAQILTTIVQTKGKAVFGIAGGRSVGGVLAHLLTHDIPWKQVHSFMLDERCVSLNSLESNYRTLEPVFFKKLPASNVHPFIFNPDNAFGSLRAYDNDHIKLGGTFDVILLSAGEDGHVAALFPNHRSIKNEGTRFILIQDAPKLPKHRMTASRKLILKSSIGVCLFFGPEKETAWQNFNDAASTIISCPAKLIMQIPESYVLKSTN